MVIEVGGAAEGRAAVRAVVAGETGVDYALVEMQDSRGEEGCGAGAAGFSGWGCVHWRVGALGRFPESEMDVGWMMAVCGAVDGGWVGGECL